MPGKALSAISVLLRGLLAVAFVCVAVWATWTWGSSQELQRGAELYAEHCAVCHGAQLEGQPDWKIKGKDGVFPAPPHDETGHTWHHDDAMLTDYIRRGGQAVLDDMGVRMTSGMPAFGAILEDDDIKAILAFIKSTWSARVQAAQPEGNGE
jgi:mono/diheme cytochrome c family protein